MWKNWTDVVSGKMSIHEIASDVAMQMIHRQPKRIIIDIKLREDFPNDEAKGYYTKVWISSADFKKWR